MGLFVWCVYIRYLHPTHTHSPTQDPTHSGHTIPTQWGGIRGGIRGEGGGGEGYRKEAAVGCYAHTARYSQAGNGVTRQY